MTESTDKQPKFRRLRKSVKWTFRIGVSLALAGIVLAIIHVVWTNHRGEAAAERTIQALRDRGIGIPVPAPKRIPDEENAARYYLAAAKLLYVPDRLYNKAPAVGTADWPLFGEGFSDEQEAVLEELVAMNQLGLELMRRVGPEDRLQLGIAPQDTLYQGGMTLYELRKLARWHCLDLLAATANGDMDRAATSCAAILRLAQQTEDPDAMVCFLVRISIVAMAHDVAEKLLSRAALTDAQLLVIREAVERTRMDLNLAAAVRAELAQTVPILKDPESALVKAEHAEREMARLGTEMLPIFTDQEVDLDEPFGLATWEWVQDAAARTYHAWCPGAFQLETAAQIDTEVLAFFDLIADPNTDPAELAARARRQSACDARTHTEEEHRDPNDEIMTGMTLSLRTYLQADARLQATAAALDVERFRLREARWPKGLAEVYPEGVPLDIHGQPLRMRVDGDLVRVYSIGANGIDEKGIVRWDDDSVTDEEDDMAFKLLNPAKRGRPATTPVESEDEPFNWGQFDNMQTPDDDS